MKLGVANRITVSDLESDDTQPMSLATYSRTVELIQYNDPDSDALAAAWLAEALCSEP